MIKVLIAGSSLLISDITFSTNDDLPHRLGEIIIVLTPWVRFLDSFNDSSFRSVNALELTVLPKTKGDWIILCSFIPPGNIPKGIKYFPLQIQRLVINQLERSKRTDETV